MGFFLQILDKVLPDPQPELVFEIGEGSVQGARWDGTNVLAHAERPLPPTAAIDPEPIAGELDELRDAVADVVRDLGTLTTPHAAVLLPDNLGRLAVFEFERVPRRPRDLRRAVEERFHRSFSVDIRAARIGFHWQAGSRPASVLAATIPTAAVLHCEQAFKAAGLTPDYVGLATAACLRLIDDPDMAVLLKLSRGSMTMVAVENGIVRLVRQVALAPDFGEDAEKALEEILADLFPTLVYIGERLERPASRLLLTGLDGLLPQALDTLPREVGCPVMPLTDSTAPDGVGLRGYIHG